MLRKRLDSEESDRSVGGVTAVDDHQPATTVLVAGFVRRTGTTGR